MSATRKTAIINATILRPGRELRKGSLLLDGDKIAGVLPERFPSLPAGIKTIDARQNYVCPGLIDLHLHGGGGSHFSDKTHRNFLSILKTHARFGTTSLLPTLTASSQEDVIGFIRFIKKELKDSKLRRRVLGLNLEGPFLSIGKRGAQPLRFIRPPNLEDVEKILEEADGFLKIMTLAPELEGAMELIGILKQAGVIPAIGHTNADYEITRRAIKAGLSYATHIFNSYPLLHHRQPGPIGALLESDEVDVEILADGIHVSPVMIRLLLRLKKFEKVIMVTDANAALGERIRHFTMAGREVKVKAGRAQLKDHTLVGSVLPLNQVLKKMVGFTAISLPRLLSLATLHPARLLKLEKMKGDLEEGMDADILIMDRRLRVKRTLVGGETIYRQK